MIPDVEPAIAGSAELEHLIRTDQSAAVEQLRALARRNDAQAQLLLGQLLINGVGVGRNPDEAFRWFRCAARAKVPLAINMVGRCHEYGLGTTVNYAEAARWYRLAGAYECDWGLYNFAHLLAQGRGVAQDLPAAFAHFRLAAVRGHARAMHFLGECYEQGRGTAVDREAAVIWYRRSAEGGDFRGQASYASVLVEQGHIDEAVDLLRRAARAATPGYLPHLIASLRASGVPALQALASQEFASAAA